MEIKKIIIILAVFLMMVGLVSAADYCVGESCISGELPVKDGGTVSAVSASTTDFSVIYRDWSSSPNKVLLGPIDSNSEFMELQMGIGSDGLDYVGVSANFNDVSNSIIFELNLIESVPVTLRSAPIILEWNLNDDGKGVQSLNSFTDTIAPWEIADTAVDFLFPSGLKIINATNKHDTAKLKGSRGMFTLQRSIDRHIETLGTSNFYSTVRIFTDVTDGIKLTNAAGEEIFTKEVWLYPTGDGAIPEVPVVEEYCHGFSELFPAREGVHSESVVVGGKKVTFLRVMNTVDRYLVEFSVDKSQVSVLVGDQSSIIRERDSQFDAMVNGLKINFKSYLPGVGTGDPNVVTLCFDKPVIIPEQEVLWTVSGVYRGGQTVLTEDGTGLAITAINAGSVVVNVNDVTDTITSGNTQTVNGVEVTVTEIISHETESTKRERYKCSSWFGWPRYCYRTVPTTIYVYTADVTFEKFVSKNLPVEENPIVEVLPEKIISNSNEIFGTRTIGAVVAKLFGR